MIAPTRKPLSLGAGRIASDELPNQVIKYIMLTTPSVHTSVYNDNDRLKTSEEDRTKLLEICESIMKHATM
jgi:hypothetical protein